MFVQNIQFSSGRVIKFPQIKVLRMNDEWWRVGERVGCRGW